MDATLKPQLEGVEETLLIPLWARAKETRRPDAMFRDERAVEMVEKLDTHFERFNVAHTAVAVRTEILDEAVGRFIAAHPDALIVNLGAGLDTRFFRLDNGRLDWVEVDLPRSMALRRTLIPEGPRHRYVEGSVLEPDWLGAIDRAPGRPMLIVAEGLLIYFSEAEVRTLVTRLAERFPGAEVLFEAYAPHLTRLPLWPTILGITARFRWGLWDGRALEGWVPGLRWVESWCYFDRHPERWGPTAWLSAVPFFRSMLRIEHVALPPT